MSEFDLETGEIVHVLYRRSVELGELFAALAKAQASFESAERAGENEAFKRGGKPSRYPTLESVVEATKKGLADNDLAIIQMPGNVGNGVALTTILGHGKSGQWIESMFSVVPSKADAHGAGSTITYLRRYARMSITGIPAEDDDGNAASGLPNAQVNAAGRQQPATRATPAVQPANQGRDDAVAAYKRIRRAILENPNGLYDPTASMENQWSPEVRSDVQTVSKVSPKGLEELKKMLRDSLYAEEGKEARE